MITNEKIKLANGEFELYKNSILRLIKPSLHGDTKDFTRDVVPVGKYHIITIMHNFNGTWIQVQYKDRKHDLNPMDFEYHVEDQVGYEAPVNIVKTDLEVLIEEVQRDIANFKINEYPKQQAYNIRREAKLAYAESILVSLLDIKENISN